MSLALLRFDFVAAVLLGSLAGVSHRLGQRDLLVLTSTLMVLAGVFSLALVGGHAGFLAFALFLLVLGTQETSGAFSQPRGLMIAVVLVGFAWALIPAVPLEASLAFWGLATLAGFLLPRAVLRRRALVLLLFAGVIGGGFGYLARLDGLGQGPPVALALLMQLNDGAGYFIGRRFGRRHPFPTISPGKSLEGYFGGAAGALFGLVLLNTVVPVFVPGSLWQEALLWGFVVVAADAGDLLLSRIKRTVGQKDFGTILPGHGGVLDRFDGWVVAAPVLFVLCTVLPHMLAGRP